ncbi:hypothetical protein BH23THE1_BH23THE1_36370 [soil metagenome]
MLINYTFNQVGLKISLDNGKFIEKSGLNKDEILFSHWIFRINRQLDLCIIMNLSDYCELNSLKIKKI